MGVATAKVFAYAIGAEVLGISTLEAIAAAAPDGVEAVSVAVDAQRGDVVAQSFRRHPHADPLRECPARQADAPSAWLGAAGEPALLPLDQWLAGLPPGFAVSGPVLKKWTAPLPEGLTMLDRQLWRPTAANVARLAHRDYLAGRRDDLWNLLPLYSRPSAAEEKWGKK